MRCGGNKLESESNWYHLKKNTDLKNFNNLQILCSKIYVHGNYLTKSTVCSNTCLIPKTFFTLNLCEERMSLTFPVMYLAIDIIKNNLFLINKLKITQIRDCSFATIR